MAGILRVANNIESILCRMLLVSFVTLLFIQIISREVFGESITWIEEISVYMFVWFVFLGASHAAKMSAHNRVTFQFRFLPKRTIALIESFADLFWLFFNVYFIYLAVDFVFFRMNKFWKSQTLGVEMKWVYIILPIAFTLMTIRVLQVNYKKLVRKEVIDDPDKVDMDQLRETLEIDVPLGSDEDVGQPVKTTYKKEG